MGSTLGFWHDGHQAEPVGSLRMTYPGRRIFHGTRIPALIVPAQREVEDKVP